MSKELHMLVLLLCLCGLGLPQLTDLTQKYGKFADYKETYGKTYSSESQESYRMNIHIENLKKYEEINSNSTFTYQAGVNHFSDLTQDEFVETYLNMKQSSSSLLTVQVSDYKKNLKDIDWTLFNRTTPVKNMGACGASWAYATVSIVEFSLKSSSFPNPDLSQQQIIDCATLTSASGCESGNIADALQFIRVKGITFQELYPLAPTPEKRPCRNDVQGVFKIKKWKKLESGCDEFYDVLGRSPLAAIVDAYYWNMYKKGVMNSCREPEKTIDKNGKTAVVVVGVTKEYWKLQTSWGRKFGEDGHIRLDAGKICMGKICREGYTAE